MTLSKDISGYLEKDMAPLTNIKEAYEKMPLPDAIKNAASGKNPNGKMNSHQKRIGAKNCAVSIEKMMLYEKEIAKCKNFEQLFDITEEVRKNTEKLGDLWSYDTALRIGFSLGIYPDYVYIQAGVVKGVQKVFEKKKPKGRYLPLTDFPKEFKVLEPYQAENFLCIWGKKTKSKGC